VNILNHIIKIALVQMFSEKGAVEQNLAETSRHIEEAHKRGIDIIAFPEASITGYHHRQFPHAVITQDGPEVAKFVKMTEGKGLTALAGIIEKNPDGVPFITHIVASGGKLTGYHRKVSGTEVDGEGEAPGKEYKVFDHDGLTFGIALCADINVETLFEACSWMGAKVMFEVAAPDLEGDRETRDWKAGYEWWESICLKRLSNYAKKYGLWIPVASQAGRTSDEDFPGGGFLFNPQGERVYTTNDWQPGVVYLEINMDTEEVIEL
jgi:predicted amidohydrolase